MVARYGSIWINSDGIFSTCRILDSPSKNAKIMEDNRQEQVEALEVMAEFNGRLVKNLPILVKELSGNRLEDTDKFLKSIIDAINWEIQVVNGTMDVLNDGRARVDKEAFNEKIIAVGNAVASKDDEQMAEAFENVIPVFEQLGTAVQEVLA